MRFVIWLIALAWAVPSAGAGISIDAFGTTARGEPVSRIAMTNDRGMRVALISYGATLTALEVPDRTGRVDNVVLSLPTIAAYEASSRRWGGVVGRYAGRIGKAAFRLDGIVHHLEPGRNGVTLHGGSNGYDKRVWTFATSRDVRSVATVFTLVSPDGDQGFPGRLTVHVTYRLMLRSNLLRIEYRATTSAPTVFNPTNHMFLNLAGAGNGTIDAHRLRLSAERYAETDASKVPTGRFAPVRGTVLDFRARRTIGVSAARADPLLVSSDGFDHSYVVANAPLRGPRPVAMIDDPGSGRRLVIASTESALQFNTGNGFDGSETGSEGVAYPAYAGVAIETQHLPDSPNQSSFPTTTLRPGRGFLSITEYRFSTN